MNIGTCCNLTIAVKTATRFPFALQYCASHLHPDQADLYRTGAERRHSSGNGTDEYTQKHKLRAVQTGYLWHQCMNSDSRGMGTKI